MQVFAFKTSAQYKLHSNATHMYNLSKSILLLQLKCLKNLKVAMACDNFMYSMLQPESKLLNFIIIPNCFCWKSNDVLNADISTNNTVRILIERLHPHSHNNYYNEDQGNQWFINRYPSQCIILDIFTLTFVVSIFIKDVTDEIRMKILTDFCKRNNTPKMEHMLKFFELAMKFMFTDVVMALFVIIFCDDANERQRIMLMYYEILEDPVNQQILQQLQSYTLNYKQMGYNLQVNQPIIHEISRIYYNQQKLQSQYIILPVHNHYSIF